MYHDPSLDPNSYLSDSQSDDDLFDFEANQDDWKNILYGDSCDEIFDDEKPKMENVTYEPSIVSHGFSPLEDDSLSPSECSIEHHFFCENKVFNPGILAHGKTHFTMKLTPDKNFKFQPSFEKLLILEISESSLVRLNNDLTHDCVDHDPGEDVSYHEKCLNDEFIPTLPPGLVTQPKSLNLNIPMNQGKLNFKEVDFKIFLPFITLGVISLLFNSFGSEDTIFDPDIISNSFHY